MHIAIGVAIAGLIGLMLARTALKGSRLSSAIERFRETGEAGVVIEAVQAVPEDQRPSHWDQAIGGLWQNYARREAAILTREAVKCSGATILQYWMRQVLEVEPAIARDVFTREFLDEYFDADVAARCGKSGCCG